MAPLYNRFAASVLGYLPLFGRPPPELWRIESSSLHRLLRWPQNATSVNAIHCLRLFGGPTFSPLRSMVHATSLNFALKHEVFLLGLRNELMEEALQFGDARKVLAGDF